MMLLPAWENKACWPAPSVTCGAAGAVAPAHKWVLVSWHFRVKVASCIVGGVWSLCSFVCPEAELTAEHVGTLGTGDQEC
jgi:hypothetical protein